MSFNAKSTISLFLPRLHINDTRQFIIDTFHDTAIGRVFEIDMKKPDNKNPFAFIKVQLYNTDCSLEFMENILNKGIVRIPLCINGKEGYWVVNNYITKKNRGYYHKGEVSTNTKINTKIETKMENYNHDKARPYKNTSFTMEDIDIMDKEFDVLSYLIFQKCQGQGQGQTF